MFPYIGGKKNQVKILDKIFPNYCDNFVEVFGGAGWVSLKSKLPPKANIHVYNDFNQFIANIFYCAKKDTAKLLATLNTVPFEDQATFERFQQEIFVTLAGQTITMGNFDLAAKYLYLQTNTFSGNTLNATSTSYFTYTRTGSEYASKTETLKRKLAGDGPYVERLRKLTTVENMDCIDVINKYDDEDTFFYIDPPYYNMSFYYTQDFPITKHQELADCLGNIKGKFALSYYDTPELRAMYPTNKFNWFSHKVYRPASTQKKSTTKSTADEIIITNYDPLMVDTEIFTEII